MWASGPIGYEGPGPAATAVERVADLARARVVPMYDVIVAGGVADRAAVRSIGVLHRYEQRKDGEETHRRDVDRHPR